MRYFYIFIIHFLVTDLSSQKIQILSTGDIHNLALENNSVLIGFHDDATLGLDTAFGEAVVIEDNNTKNIYAIHRDSLHFECGYDNNRNEVFFKNNIALSNDIRSNSVSDNNLFFQIANKSALITDIAIYDTTGEPLKNTIEFFVVIRNCGHDDEKIEVIPSNAISLDYSITNFQSANHIDGPISSIIIKIKENVVSSSELTQSEKIHISPNPTNGHIILTTSSQPDKITITNANGILLKNITLPYLENNRIYLDIEDMSKGIYFMNLYFHGRIESHRIAKI